MADTHMESVEKYVEATLRALDLEIQEELKKSQDSLLLGERSFRIQDTVLKSLAVTSCNIAPYGEVLIHFGNDDKKSLKSHSISTGDKVMVTVMSKVKSTLEGGMAGCVEVVNEKEITVAFDDIQLFEAASNNLFQLVKIVDDVTYNRMKNAVKCLLKFPSETKNIRKLLFDSVKLEQISLPPAILGSNGKILFCNATLHPAQKEAIEFALKQKHFGIIHGPPGTGKTTTLVELIFQLVKSREKVLVCAPSNVAVDNIMAKLQDYPLKCVRLGHPSRVSEENRPLTLNAYFEASLPAQGLKDAKLELQNLLKTLVLSKSSKKEQASYQTQIRKLRSEIHRRETKMASEALLGVDVCFATLGSSYRENILRYFPKEFFSSLVIDEASQSLESGCWMAIPYAKRCILAGDHHQLSPVILSQEAAQLGLSITLMERAIDKLGSDCVMLLSHQFRMNQKIMDWVSRETYGGQLTADSSVANHLLVDIPGVEETDETNTPLLLVDTSGCSLREHCFHLSYGNSGEADLVAHMANLMVKAGVTRQSIAIITPYNRQVDLIKESLANLSIGDIEVKTVDGFQGGESEAVILSLVRSNLQGELGFVSDKRRINVAVSRARRLLCVIADSSTVGKDKTIASLIKHIREYGQVRSAHEVRDDVISITNTTLHLEDQKKPAPKKHKKTKKTKLYDLDEPVTFENFRQKLQQFVASNETTLVIESKLTGFKQLKVVAEIKRLGLEFEVQGEECIHVKKDAPEESACKLHGSKTFELFESDLQAKFLQFTDSDANDLRFPDNLNEAQQACIKEYANQKGFRYTSIGLDGNRHILVVSKSDLDIDWTPVLRGFSHTQDTAMEFSPSLGSRDQACIEEKAETFGLYHSIVDDGCGQYSRLVVQKLPFGEDSEEHLERAETLSEISLEGLEIGKAKPQIASTLSHSRKKKKKKKQPALAIEEPNSDVSDNFLDKLVKTSGQCASESCKVGVRLIGHNCPHCKQRYCISHTLPEVHGCTAEAKKAARKEFTHPTPKSLSDDKRKALLKTLKSKVAAKTDMRTAAKK